MKNQNQLTLENDNQSLEHAIQQKRFKDEWQKAAVNILYTGSWLKNMSNDFLKAFGLTAQQYNVLRILRGQYPNGITTLEIRKRLLDKMSDTSRLVDRLERDGWVSKQRAADDKRLVSVVITQKGLDCLKEIDSQEDALNGVIRKLSSQEAIQLSQLLDKIRG